MSNEIEKQENALERSLIDRAQGGDEAALEELLRIHQDRVFRTALSLVGGDEEAAMEVAQDVLISAFRHIGQFRGESKFSTWLYKMAVNFSKNRAMAEGRRAARFVSLEPPSRDSDSRSSKQYPDSGPTPRDCVAGGELFEILQTRIGELADEFRSVLVLRYMEDLTYEEIAEALSIPVGTVKSRINRARGELRKLMRDVLDSEEGLA